MRLDMDPLPMKGASDSPEAKSLGGFERRGQVPISVKTFVSRTLARKPNTPKPPIPRTFSTMLECLGALQNDSKK